MSGESTGSGTERDAAREAARGASTPSRTTAKPLRPGNGTEPVQADVRAVRAAVRVARFLVGTAFVTLLGAVLVQVAGRLYGSSAVWTEELTRYALLFTVAFGAGLALRSGDLVNVDVLSESLPGRVPRLLRMLSAAATAALALFLLPHAWRYVSIGKLQTSPALGVRMDFVHASVWLMLLFLAFFALARLFEMVVGGDGGSRRRTGPSEG